MGRTSHWLKRQATRPAALWVLACVSFMESSFFPIPPDLLLIPLVLAAPHRAWLIAGVCTGASVLGGIAGYAIGVFAFESLGRPMLEMAGKAAHFEGFAQTYNEWGVAVVLVAGITPLPYKVVTIFSGATAMPLMPFIVGSIVARGIRFFLIAGLLRKFGAPIAQFIEKRFWVLSIVIVVILILPFVVWRLT